MKFSIPVAVLGTLVVLAALAIGGKAWRDAGMRTAADGHRVPAASAEDLRAVAAVQRRWADAMRLAESTSRIALPPVVADLQAQRRALDELTLGACMRAAVDAGLARQMDETIALYLAFMALDDGRSRAEALMERQGAADQAGATFETAKRACLP